MPLSLLQPRPAQADVVRVMVMGLQAGPGAAPGAAAAGV